MYVHAYNISAATTCAYINTVRVTQQSNLLIYIQQPLPSLPPSLPTPTFACDPVVGGERGVVLLARGGGGGGGGGGAEGASLSAQLAVFQLVRRLWGDTLL